MSQSLFTIETPNDNVLDDDAGVTLGVRLVTSVNGTISTIKFWRPVGDSHNAFTVAIWQNASLLIQKNASGMTASGWQTVTLDSPVNITAGQEYIIGMWSPGDYAYTANALPITVDDLTALGSLYRYTGGTVDLPDNASIANYFIDVVFHPAGSATSAHGALSSVIGAAMGRKRSTVAADSVLPSVIGAARTDYTPPRTVYAMTGILPQPVIMSARIIREFGFKCRFP